MSKLLVSETTVQELQRGLRRLKLAGMPDADIAKMCEANRSMIKVWRDGPTVPRRFDQVLLVVRALVGSLGSEGELGPAEVAQEEEETAAEDNSLMEPWEEFLKRRHPNI